MSERDDLLALAESKGVKVDKRLGLDKLRALADDKGWSTDDTSATPAPVADPEPDPVLAEEAVNAAADDEWPKRIAPCAWLDQDGNRWTDLGQAGEAVDRIRARR